jgi:hypothetical protein
MYATVDPSEILHWLKILHAKMIIGSLIVLRKSYLEK